MIRVLVHKLSINGNTSTLPKRKIFYLMPHAISLIHEVEEETEVLLVCGRILITNIPAKMLEADIDKYIPK